MDDIIWQIGINIHNIKDLINYSSISKQHNIIIKKNRWLHIILKLSKNSQLLLMIKNYNFGNIDLSYSNMTDESVSKLINAHTLYLSGTNVTDESVFKLTNAHTLYLGGTNVTDESVSKLINAHTLILSCTNVTDKSVSKLINAHTLDLSCTKVTDSRQSGKLLSFIILRVAQNNKSNRCECI